MKHQSMSEEDCGGDVKNTLDESTGTVKLTTADLSEQSCSTKNKVPQTSDQLNKEIKESSAIVNHNRSTKQRERRPDRAVYIPRARRSQTTPPSKSLSIDQPYQSTKPYLSKVAQSSGKKSHHPSNIKAVISPQSSQTNTRKNKENSDVIQHKVVTDNYTLDTCSFFNKKHGENYSNEHWLPTKWEEDKLDEINYLDRIDCDLKAKKQNLHEAIVESSEDGIDLHCLEYFGQPSSTIIIDNNDNNISKIMVGVTKNIRFEDESNSGSNMEYKEDKKDKEVLRVSKEINRSNKKNSKQTFNSSVLEISDRSNSDIHENSKNPSKQLCDPENDDWETLFDDNGDCLDPNLLKEFTAVVDKVKINQPKTDYSLYQNKQELLNEEEFPHVLEVSNFPVEFKTQDLMMIFSEYKESGFEIKWVDDTHALAVFSSSKIAAEILASNHPFVCLKPLGEATAESQSKAKKCSNSLQPYRPRPETCTALARRLVTGALGVRLKTTREELENERRVLQAAKERKRLAAKQRDEVWEN